MKCSLLTPILTLALTPMLLWANDRQPIASADELPVGSYSLAAASACSNRLVRSNCFARHQAESRTDPKHRNN